jgi:hypothetical protein
MVVNCFRRKTFICNGVGLKHYLKWICLHITGNYGEIVNVELSMDRLVSPPVLFYILLIIRKMCCILH